MRDLSRRDVLGTAGRHGLDPDAVPGGPLRLMWRCEFGRRLGAVAVTLAALGAATSGAGAQRADGPPWRPDLGDGRYRNPVLFADYSDLDVVRVGGDYWMTASSFGHVPGLPILHSRDLVHWRIVNHALPRLGPDFDRPQHGNGVWAPSIRHRAGWYWIYWGDPDRGIYMTRARDPRGRWSEPVLVRAAKGWIDPTPLWDDDGQAYLVRAFARSRSGIKHRLVVHRMSPDGTRLLDDGALVFEDSVRHPTAEGPKLHKRDGWYWILAPAGGVATGWQLAMRSRHPLGPYEHRVVLAQGATPVNGPHQGAWVDTPAGAHWFLHFQDRGVYGRIVHLQPMRWRADGWPVIGAAADTSTVGTPVAVHPKPRVQDAGLPAWPATSDEFDRPTLGLQWQWNGDPRPTWASLTARPGALRLTAQPLDSGGANLTAAPHLLLQKLPAPAFTATARLAPRATATGETFGLVVFGLDYAWVGVRRTATGYALVQARAADADRGGRERDEAAVPPASLGDGPITLRATVANPGGDTARVQFAYSVDGQRFVDVGAPFVAREGRWVGAKMGLFALAPGEAAADVRTGGGRTRGHVDVDYFRIR
jgi:beta-xylosidase